MNKEVKLPLATLLKEKGFDKKCEKYYNPDCDSVLIENKKSILHEAYRIQAPTIDEVKWWFYDKHDIWIVIDTLGDENIFPRWGYKIVNLTNYNSNIEWELNQLNIPYEEMIKKSFNSPIEAYEAAFEYLLNELI